MNTLREVAGTIQELISLDEVKEHLRVTGEEEDSYISAILTVARKFVENETGTTLRSGTFDYFIDDFECDEISLPGPPLVSVTHVKYYNNENALTTLVEDTDYRVDANKIPGLVEAIGSWPGVYDRSSAVQIRYIAGTTVSDEVDPVFVQAIKIKTGLMFDNREGDVNLEKSLTVMLNKLKRPTF